MFGVRHVSVSNTSWKSLVLVLEHCLGVSDAFACHHLLIDEMNVYVHYNPFYFSSLTLSEHVIFAIVTQLIYVK